MRTRLVAAVLAVFTLGTTATACPPQPGGGPSGACAGPNQALEAADPSLFSLPHAISANGQWVVTSRTVGEDYQLTLRSTAPADTGSVVAVVARSTLDGVAVSNDATRIVLYRRSITPSILSFEQVDTATGQVTTVSPPDLALPDGAVSQRIDPGVPYSGSSFLSSADRVSRDAQRALWTRRVYWGSHSDVTSVLTDVVTGAVLWESAVVTVSRMQFSPSMTAAVDAAPIGASGGTAEPKVIDMSDGSTRSLLPARAALTAAGVPDSRQWAMGVSDDGRHVVFGHSTSGYTDQLFSWDVVAEELREVPLLSGWEVLAQAWVDDRGRIQFFRITDSVTAATTAHLWDPSTDKIATLASNLYLTAARERAFHRTPDLARFVTSIQRTTPPLGVELRLIGCP